MGIISHDSNHTCPMPSHLIADAPEPFVADLSFRQFNMILSGSCAAFSTILILILMTRHAIHFSKPNEQKKIMQICSLIPFYSILSFITIAAPESFFYLLPWLDVIQAVALGNFFLLLCEFVSPCSDEREVFFSALKVQTRQKGQQRIQDGLEWYRKMWILVFQYPIVALVVAVVTDVTQAAGIYCYESSKPYFSHLWLTIIITISIVIAVVSVVKFYAALKQELGQHRPLSKFLAFKLIIGLTFIERILFQILRSTGALEETNQLTYADVNLGIQTMVVCIEMVPFSIFFHYAYSVSPYVLSKSPSSTSSEHGTMSFRTDERNGYSGGFLGWNAWVAVFDPREILLAIKFAFVMRSESMKLPSYEQATTNPAFQASNSGFNARY